MALFGDQTVMARGFNNGAWGNGSGAGSLTPVAEGATSAPDAEHAENDRNPTYRAATNVTHTGDTTLTFSPDGVSRPFLGFTLNNTIVLEF